MYKRKNRNRHLELVGAKTEIVPLEPEGAKLLLQSGSLAPSNSKGMKYIQVYYYGFFMCMKFQMLHFYIMCYYLEMLPCYSFLMKCYLDAQTGRKLPADFTYLTESQQNGGDLSGQSLISAHAFRAKK